jgi:hypothetical protein
LSPLPQPGFSVSAVVVVVGVVFAASVFVFFDFPGDAADDDGLRGAGFGAGVGDGVGAGCGGVGCGGVGCGGVGFGGVGFGGCGFGGCGFGGCGVGGAGFGDDEGACGVARPEEAVPEAPAFAPP